jgi:hypothetical protein
MRRRYVIALLALLVAIYAWPMLAALQLRLALRSGDAARIEPCVDWTALRANLKATVRGNLQPDASASWWRRTILDRAVPALADRAIDMAVSPSRLAWFLRRRMQVLPDTAPATQSQPSADDEIDTITSPRRLRYAFFDGPSRFRLEISDPDHSNRRLVAVLARDGLRWRLHDVAYVTRSP